MNLKNLPVGFFPLFLVEFTTRFFFWGLQSILVLYLVRLLGFKEQTGYLIYGAFTTLAFMLSIMGGIIADKLYGFKSCVFWGLIFSLAGNCLLFIGNNYFFYLGLAAILIGFGLITPNSPNLLGNLYVTQEEKRESGFTLYYLATNLGGLLGPVFYGILIQSISWRSGFILSASILAICLFLFVHNKNKYSQKEINPTKKVTLHFLQKSKIFPIILFTLLTLLTSILIYFPHYVGIFLAFVIAATAFVLFYSSIKFDSKQRKIILILLLMMFFCMIFFANEFQVNNSLLIFSDKHVNRTVLGWKLPTNVLAALEPMFVVILAPLLSILWDFTARKNKTLSIFKKITIGMLLECFGFALLAWVIYLFAYNEKLLPLFWIILTCMLLGLGELFIMPTVIAAITRFASKELKGLLMGVLYLALALSGYLSGYIAMLTTQHFFWSASGVSLYTKTYIFVALIALIGSVVAFIISYFSHRITPLPGC